MAAPTPASLDITAFVLGIVATVIAYIVLKIFGAAIDAQFDEAADTTKVEGEAKADVDGDRWVF